jgi:hypothetical protein
VLQGFIDISSTGGRNIAIKNIGQLSDKPFLRACLKKLTPKEASVKASEMYSFWQKQLLNTEWKPSKTLADEGSPKVLLHHLVWISVFFYIPFPVFHHLVEMVVYVIYDITNIYVI